MIEIKAPNPVLWSNQNFHMFLAGSIEMGTAEQWQKQVVKAFTDEDVVILNPRRDEWDSSWTQSINNPQFYEQVSWELQAQEISDLIIMYFSPTTMSPITLLELGLFKDHPMIVTCPDGFWRKGNVDIVCQRYGIKQATDLNDLIIEAKKFYKSNAWGS